MTNHKYVPTLTQEFTMSHKLGNGPNFFALKKKIHYICHGTNQRAKEVVLYVVVPY